MKEKHLQHVSSLLDNELHADDAAHVIDALHTTEDSGKKLDRYALIGSALRDEMVVVYEESFLTKVQQAIAEEPVVFAPVHVKKHSNKPYVAVAFAASFAFLSVILFNVFPGADNSSGLQPYADNGLEVDSNLVFEDEPQNMELEDYFRRHNGVAPEQNQIQNTRLVGFEKE
ncbi:MAG: hypothetical protein COB26_00455 [Piscirickettsiaceae bacterium]|nr:MAG: hypothetical protein COB26_06870 [Piscirickettsiaceae bacterium]PCI72197.1 MAG: hypothetical protein COB26_00455 [Piscirickettsiaceae bacterium]